MPLVKICAVCSKGYCRYPETISLFGPVFDQVVFLKWLVPTLPGRWQTCTQSLLGGGEEPQRIMGRICVPLKTTGYESRLVVKGKIIGIACFCECSSLSER